MTEGSGELLDATKPRHINRKSWWYYLAIAFLLVVRQRSPCAAREYHIDSQRRFDALRNVTIRYNVSQNDKAGIYFYGFERQREARNVHIYNNTHFVGKGLDVRVFPKGRTPINSRFENNIFFFAGRGEWGKHAKGINTIFRNNLYFNIRVHQSDTRPIVAHPLFARPGTAGTDIELKTMNSLRGYQLKPASPCIDVGLTIAANGGRDLFGTEVRKGITDIGAAQRSR